MTKRPPAPRRSVQVQFTRSRRIVFVAVLQMALLLAGSGVAEAHVGNWSPGEPWWTAWNWDPLILLNLTALAGFYSLGVRRLWQKAGVGRSIARWQVVAFGASLLALFGALISPLDPLSDQLSWVHMTQHMVLMLIAAPLFILGSPGFVLVWALPKTWRRGVGRFFGQNHSWGRLWRISWNPFFVWAVYALVLWAWHLPILYQAALRDPVIHDLEHLTFFAAALLFWRVLIDPLSRFRLNYGLGVLFLFTTSLHSMVLGIFMTLAPQPWYADYEGTTELWNLTPLEDQQLAGLIMWMPACTIHTLAAAIIFGLWFRDLGDKR